MMSSMRKYYPQVSFKAIPMGDLFNVIVNQQSGMEKIYEKRRTDLAAFIKSIGRGAIARISEAADIDASYLSRCLYPPGKAGKKNIGDEIAIKLDQHFPEWRDAGEAGKIVRKLHAKTERERAMDELHAVVKKLDIAGINKLTERALVLLEQHAIKEKRPSSA